MYITCTYGILISVFSVGWPRVYILNNCNTHMCMHTCAHIFLLMFAHMQGYACLCVCVPVHVHACRFGYVCPCAFVHACVYHNYKKII